MRTKLFVFLILSTMRMMAQFGGIDLAFNPGISTNDLSTINDVSYDKTNQKVLIVGDFTSFGGVTNKGVAVLNENGDLFSGFSSPFNSESTQTAIYKASWLPDGKILVTGYNVSMGHFIKKLNTDGSIDSSFSLTVNAGITGLLVESDGKIIICGGFTNVGGVPRIGIARITSSGLVDATFYPGSGVPAGQYIYSIDKQSNGKYIIGGYFWQYDIYSPQYIARLNNDGSYDGTFNPGTGPNNTVTNITVLKNDKIIASGNFTAYNSAAATNKIAQLNSNGSVDSTALLGNFSIAGNALVVSHKVLSDGQIILYADATFTFSGGVRTQIAKINQKGNLNQEFNGGSGFSYSSQPYIQKIILLPTGKLLAVGRFNSYNGNSIKNAVRILDKIDNSSSSFCHQIVDRISSLDPVNPLGRIYTDGVSSSCAVVKTFPGANAIGNCSYKTYNFINNSSVSQCVTFSLKNQSSNSWMLLSVYNGSYNPANLSQNYIGGFGGSVLPSDTQKCSIQISAGQSIVVVISENEPDFYSANGDYILSIDGLCNYPTVTVRAMPGFDYSSRKPVIYYSAKFNMPVGGFTNSDISVDTNTGTSVKAFIKDTGIASNNKDFIIGVTGMQSEGYVDIKIPTNAVFSLDEGTSNLESINLSNWSSHSNSQTTFLNSGISCTKPSSDGVIQNLHEVNVYNTPDSNCGFTKNYFIDNNSFNTKVHTYQNTSGFDQCIGVKIKKSGLTSYNFNAYRATTFMSGNYLTDWIGGSDGAVYTYNGDTYDCSYINVPNGENFYIQVFTENNDYEIILTDITCTNVLANEDFSLSNNFKIHPNPTSGFFKISSDKVINEVKVYNAIGQIIYTTSHSEVDISNQPVGVYLIEIFSENKKTIQKIIKTN